MRIGIVCYPSVGGSGVVATELGKHLALRGHAIHFISYDQPFRLRGYRENVFFHAVDVPSYPLFKHPPYLLALANKIVQVARTQSLDIVHVHYAIPHAISALLAKNILDDGFKVITTLHGTDITLVGSDPTFAATVTYSINASDGVSAVSESLRAATYRQFRVSGRIRTIYNFVDTAEWRRVATGGLRERFARPGEIIIMHASNFRAVKRLDDVLAVYLGVKRQLPARLLLVGEGPELARILSLVRAEGLEDEVAFLGNQEDVVELLSIADLFLLPSAEESFGLAALEAMACGVPVVATRAGGLPEVIEDGVSGYLCPVGDVPAMVEAAVAVLSHPGRREAITAAARRRVEEKFSADRIVPVYEDFYREVLADPWPYGLI